MTDLLQVAAAGATQVTLELWLLRSFPLPGFNLPRWLPMCLHSICIAQVAPVCAFKLGIYLQVKQVKR